MGSTRANSYDRLGLVRNCCVHVSAVSDLDLVVVVGRSGGSGGGRYRQYPQGVF